MRPLGGCTLCLCSRFVRACVEIYNSFGPLQLVSGLPVTSVPPMDVPNGAPEASGRGVRQRKPKAADGFVTEMPIRKVGPARRAGGRLLTCAFDASVLPLDEAMTTKKGLWTLAEDALLEEAVSANDGRGWSRIALALPGRTGKQCRERWHNHLQPNINKEAWTEQEDLQIQLGVVKHGHKWSLIARGIPGRTDNQIKNRYNCTVQKYGQEEYQSNAISTKAFLDELKRRNARTELEAVPLMRLANPRFALKNQWSAEEVAKLQDAMRRVQDEDAPHKIDWQAVAFLVGNRTDLACRAQWGRMCEACSVQQRAANPLPPPPPPPLPPELEPIPVEAESALTMMVEEDEEDAFVSAAGEAAWNEIKLMCFENYDEGSATDPPWTRSFQWDMPTFEARHKMPVSFNFRHPSRPLKLALHMCDVRRHLIPMGHTGKRGSPMTSWTTRDCSVGTDLKMTEYYKEKKRREEEAEEEALVKSVLG